MRWRCLGLIVVSFLSSMTSAKAWTDQKISAPDGASGDAFGIVDASGGRLAVGAPQDDPRGDDSGSVTVFSKGFEGWEASIQLMAHDGVMGDRFGSDVSIFDDILVVGAVGDDDRGNNTGSAYVFRQIDGKWSQEAKLVASDGAASDRFGTSVAASGDTIVVGAYNHMGLGAAYVYRHIDGFWLLEAKLMSDASLFGYSVAISGDRLVIGAFEAAFVYGLSQGEWAMQSVLTPFDGAKNGVFGNAVAMYGDRIAVAAWLDDQRASNAGAVYLYRSEGSQWSGEAKLVASDGQADDYFGGSIALSGRHLLVGAHADDDRGTVSGSAYLFEMAEGTWIQDRKLVAGDGTAWDAFGTSVSLSPQGLFVGSPGDDDRGADSGSVYSYCPSPSVEIVEQPPTFNSVTAHSQVPTTTTTPNIPQIDLTTPEGNYDLTNFNSGLSASASDLFLQMDGEIASGCCGGGTSDIDFPWNRYGYEMILPHSGQESKDEVDLLIRGRDPVVHLKIARRHLTRVNFQRSLFGPAWDFNLGAWFRQRPDGQLELHQFGRTHIYPQVNGTTWGGSVGRMDQMGFNRFSSTMTMRMSGGTTLQFLTAREGGFLHGILQRVTSPDGNRLTFHYEDSGPLLQRRLQRIVDSFGRDILFYYEDPDFPQGVSRIVDVDGREVAYDYNSRGQLVSVRSPRVTTTGGLNDFPQGKTKQYTYLNHADSRLANALTGVVFPNQVNGGQETRLAWSYITQSAHPFFGYVETHTIGNQSANPSLRAGGTYRYTYTSLGSSADVNVPVIRTEILDRRNTLTVVDSNRHGQVLEESIYEQNSPRVFTHRFIYNDDGDLVQRINPMGGVSLHAHADPMTSPRFSHANLTETIHYPDPRGADQTEIRSRTIYEPIFNRPYKVTSARGFVLGNDPDDFTTTYTIDYMEDLNASIAIYAPMMGLSESELEALMVAAGIVDLNRDVNGDGRTDMRCGCVIKIDQPPVSLPTQAARVGLGGLQQASELRQYNQFGQLLCIRDAEENVTIFEYYGANDPDGDGHIDVPGADPNTGGYLKRTISDVASTPGRQSGQNPTPALQVVTLSYVAQGSFPGNRRGLPTSILDPRGIETRLLVNELDQIVTTVRAADVSASPESGLVAHAYERRVLFDANDNVLERWERDQDTLGGQVGWIRETYTYDILDRPRLIRQDAAGADETVTALGYDASENMISRTRGFGTPDASTDTWTFDERDLAVSLTRGKGSADEATVRGERDLNGNLVRHFDAEGGDVSSLDVDGFDRPREYVDRVGQKTLFWFDSHDNLISVERRGPVDHLDPGESSLAREDLHYDQRNRLFRRDGHLFHYAGKQVGSLDDGDLDRGDGLVSTVYVYDRLSRLVATIDPDDDLFETRYDGLSRVIRSLDPLGNVAAMTYDANNNTISWIEVEHSPLIRNDEIFETRVAYDSLNRPVTLTETGGEVTRFTYDSRDNRIRMVDALGNTVEWHHDRLNRETREVAWLSANGMHASSTNFDGSQGGGDGRISLEKGWDALSRMTSRTDDNGNTTVYVYDALDRRTSIFFGDGTTETYFFNRDDDVVAYIGPSGNSTTWTLDAKGRPMSIDIVRSHPSAIGTRFQAWGYDGMDRITFSVDDNGDEEDVVCTYLFDSLSRQIRETQKIGSRPEHRIDTEWQGKTRLTSLTYPNGRKVRRHFDARDRVSSLQEAASGSLLARFEYVGSRRVVRTTLGNGSVLDKRNQDRTQTTSGVDAGYNDSRQDVLQRWQSALGHTITSYRNAYNETHRRTCEIREHLGQRRSRWTFDSAYRALTFDYPNRSSIRTFDGADKMLSFMEGSADRSPEVDGDIADAGLNQYSSFNGHARTYDDNGSLHNDGNWLYTHDSGDRIVEVKSARTGLQIARYLYDASNRRVLKLVSGVRGKARFNRVPVEETRFLYHGWRVLEERDGKDRPQRQFVDGRGLDEHIQMKTFFPERNHYYHTNSQGFTGALTDDNGSVAVRYEYTWFGQPILRDGRAAGTDRAALENPYLFQGRRLDRETGNYYYRMRYYSPWSGEFLTVDPKGLWHHGQGNGYSAFLEDPWNRLDPMGLCGFSGMSGFLSRAMDMIQAHLGDAATAVDLGVVQSQRAARSALAAKSALDWTRGNLSCGQSVNAANRRELARAFDRSVKAGSKARLATRASQGLAVLSGVLSGANEYQNNREAGNSQGSSLVNAGGVGAAQTAANLHPGVAAANLVCNAIDVPFEAAGVERPGLAEVFINNTGRAFAGIGDWIATGDCSAVETTVRRMRKGELGILARGLNWAGEAIGEHSGLHHLFMD